MAHETTEAQIIEFKEAFAPYDKDGNCRIMSKDLGNVLRSLGENPTDAEVQVITKDVASGNGSIHFANFVSMMLRRMKEDNRGDELKEAFGMFDKDGDGFLTIVDLREAIRNLGENLTDEEIYEIIYESDADGDGKLNYEEFVRVMNTR
ncbi:calmodulin-like [Ptychodera flava]|uniref:calmodulin-like n=1 Tax=Ptychodera flava TaxID=63121 RepID=UPI00396A14CF